MRRSILALVLLITITSALVSQETIPTESRGFAGGGLHLYPLGWSSEGRWGALVGRHGDPATDGVRLLVIDAVTDEILFRSKIMNWDGPEVFDEFWGRYGRSILEKTDSFDIESSRKPDVRDPKFITGGVEYEFRMTPASPARGSYSLEIFSSRGDSKDVYGSPDSGAPDRSVLLGALVSPYEARALAVIREAPAYGSGEPEYRLTGAHLILGFRAVNDGGTPGTNPGWTATRPSNTGSLISAVYNGQEYLVRSRLAAGVDPESKDSRGYTALLLAARLGHWSMVMDLLKAGASVRPVDNDGRSALHHAAFAGNAAAVEALLAAGADTDLRDRAGRTASELAADPSLRSLLQ